MNANAIRIKIRLLVNGELKETRRLQVDDVLFINDFELFTEKLRNTFFILSPRLKITWTDCDGDVITIGNNDDLIAAFMEMNEVKLFNVEVASLDDEDQDEGPEPIPSAYSHVTCDVCNNFITRYRYKCLQCPDYDLCLNCEQAGNHSHHIMMRLANLEIPRSLPRIMVHIARTARKAAHHAAKEAHRAAKSSARVAHAAATSVAREFRCPKMSARPAPATSECPVFDTSIISNLAQTFFESLPHAKEAQSTTTANNATTPTQTDETQHNQANKGHQAAQQMAKAVDQAMTNIFAAIQSFIPQPVPASTGPGTSNPDTSNIPHSTPPGSVSSATSAGSQTSPEAGTAGANLPPDNNVVNVPMEVEQEKPIYPVISKEQLPASAPVAPPDAGWTIVPNEGSITALKPEDEKYAEALQQLRRMGFSDNIDLLALLKRYDGNIGFVVNHLFESNAGK